MLFLVYAGTIFFISRELIFSDEKSKTSRRGGMFALSLCHPERSRNPSRARIKGRVRPLGSRTVVLPLFAPPRFRFAPSPAAQVRFRFAPLRMTRWGGLFAPPKSLPPRGPCCKQLPSFASKTLGWRRKATEGECVNYKLSRISFCSQAPPPVSDGSPLSEGA